MHTSSSLAVSFISRIILSWRRRSFSRFSLPTPFQENEHQALRALRGDASLPPPSAPSSPAVSFGSFSRFLDSSPVGASFCLHASVLLVTGFKMKETLVRLRQRRRLRRLHTSAVHQFVRIALDGQSLLQRKGGGTTHARTCDDSRESGVGEATEVGDTTSGSRRPVAVQREQIAVYQQPRKDVCRSALGETTHHHRPTTSPFGSPSFLPQN